LEPTPQSLKQGAAERLKVLEAKHASVVAAIAEHERAIADLRAQLPELEFEVAAMRYIVAGPSGPAAPVERRKLSRPELVEVIRERMTSAGPQEVGILHAYLENEAAIDLGANARNYLCGVLSRNKDTHFVNMGKGEWWLAGHPSPAPRSTEGPSVAALDPSK